MAAGGPPPTIVVDYGKDVGGVPYFVVRSESRSPVLRAAYSEGLAYLGPDGDNTPSSSNAGDSSRVDDLTVASPGTLSTGSHPGRRTLRADHARLTGHRDPLVPRHPLHRRPGHGRATSGVGSIRARPSSTGSGTTGPTPPSSTSCPPAAVPGALADHRRGTRRRRGRQSASFARDTPGPTTPCPSTPGWWTTTPTGSCGPVVVVGLPLRPPRFHRPTGPPDTLQEIAIGPGRVQSSSAPSLFLRPSPPASGTT